MPRNTFVAAVAAAALAGGGAGAGVVALSHSGGTHQAAPTTTTVLATPAANVSNDTFTIGQIAKADTRSVVEIDTTTQSTSAFPYGGGGTQSAEGSGFVYDTKGDIVTNEHVVAGANTAKVKFQDGSTYTATIVGEDPSTDIAVIHVNAPASKLVPLSLGDSSTAAIGDGVVAIGNPFGLDDSVTSGIVSALNREIQSPNGTPIEGAIQTDAAINHGNSGGPLIDLQNKVIGITSQIQSEGGGSDGVGFAVPSNTVKTIADELISTGKAQHALLGVAPAAAQNGVRIASVEKNSAASSAGLKAGDVIVSVDGTAVKTPSQLRAIIASDKPGDTVTLGVRRGSSTTTVKATLGSRS